MITVKHNGITLEFSLDNGSMAVKATDSNGNSVRADASESQSECERLMIAIDGMMIGARWTFGQRRKTIEGCIGIMSKFAPSDTSRIDW